MNRVLVTGGAGLLGSNLCRALLEAGDRVLCLDSFFCSDPKNVDHLRQYEGFEVVRHDVVDPFYAAVDRVYNLACPASPVHYQTNPVHTVKTSVVGMINMLDLAERVGARVLQASTSEVYGDPEVHPQSETYWGNVNPIGPRSCYDEGKRVAETLCFDYARQNDVKVRVVRIFNTYGPGMAPGDGRVVSNFIIQALQGEPITVYGDGGQTRSFCFVDDTVEGLRRLMEGDVMGPINIGNPHELTIRELAKRIIELTGSKSTLENKPIPVDDPVRRRPDISLAQKHLDWSPTTSLDEGLERTIAYFEDLLRRK